MTIFWAAAAPSLMTGCPHEADDARDVRFSIKVTYDGTFPRDRDRQRFLVGPADASVLCSVLSGEHRTEVRDQG